MNQTWAKIGIRLSERMAGWVQFLEKDPIPGARLEPTAQYPFAFTIHAFTTKFIQYPFCLEFRGVADFPGLPLPEGATQGDRRCAIYGTMKISHRGVAYQVFSESSSPLGKWTLAGAKKYHWNPFSWKTFKHSLICLPAELKQGELPFAKGELKYLPPLWHFPFGLRLCSATWAYRRHGKLASRFFECGRFLYPDHSQLGTREELTHAIERHVEGLPYFVYILLYWVMHLLGLLALLLFFKPLSRLSPAEGEKLIQKIRATGLSKLVFLPLMTIILYSIFGQKDYLAKKGQNMVVPPKNVENEPWMAQSFSPKNQQGAVVEADCVVIGSGAGGAAFAYEMARRGKAVVILEEGPYFKRQDLTGLSAEMMRKLYRNSGIQFSLSNAPLWIPTGKCVGGTTFINSGTCIRTPESVQNRWRQELGLDLDLDSYFPAVEEMLGGTPSVPKNIQGGIARVLERGLQGTEHTFGALRRAETGCDGQSSCVAGCPIGAKRSTAVSFIPEALKRNAFLFPHMRVSKILVKNGQACGVQAEVPGFGPEFEMTIKAPLVVLAAGTFGSPDILYRSGLHRDNPHIGRHLSIHPAITLGAVFPEVVRETLFVPQSLGILGIKDAGFVLEGYTLPIDVIAAALGLWGQELASLMSEVDHFTNFSAILTDVSEGGLHLAPWGPLPYYRVTPPLMKKAMESLQMLARLFFRAGAKKVYLPLQGREVITSVDSVSDQSCTGISASRLLLSAHHPLGTCRMARDQTLGAVSPEGEFFSVKNLILADGSVIPGPLGINPQVTIMANALRLADIWSERL